MNKLIFIGTGNSFNLERQLTSLCFVVDNKPLLVDCGDGMGTLRNLHKANIEAQEINHVLITHRHADHISGMVHLLNHKLRLPTSIINIYGPKQSLQTVKSVAFTTFNSIKDNQSRINWFPLQHLHKERIMQIDVLPCRMPIKLGAICFAYKLTVNDVSITFTADTPPNKNLTLLAKNTDILIHECGGTENQRNTFGDGHSSAKDAGILAEKSGAKELILTHLPNKVTDGKNLIAEAKQYYKGKIIIARDLMEIMI